MELTNRERDNISFCMWDFMEKAELTAPDDDLLHAKLCDAVTDVLEGKTAHDLLAEPTLVEPTGNGFGALSTRTRLKDLLSGGRPPLHLTDDERLADALIEDRPPTPAGPLVRLKRAELSALVRLKQEAQAEQFMDWLREGPPKPPAGDLGEASLRAIGFILIGLGVFMLAVLIGGVLSDWLVTR